MVKKQEEFSFESKALKKNTDSKFSDFIVYVDESGDHNLMSVDASYPILFFSFCIFYKEHYSNKVVPKLQKLKFEYFGHDLVILHENEIRKKKAILIYLKEKRKGSNF